MIFQNCKLSWSTTRRSGLAWTNPTSQPSWIKYRAWDTKQISNSKDLSESWQRRDLLFSLLSKLYKTIMGFNRIRNLMRFSKRMEVRWDSGKNTAECYAPRQICRSPTSFQNSSKSRSRPREVMTVYWNRQISKTLKMSSRAQLGHRSRLTLRMVMDRQSCRDHPNNHFVAKTSIIEIYEIETSHEICCLFLARTYDF